MSKHKYTLDINWKICEKLIVNILEGNPQSEENKKEFEFLKEIGFLDENYTPTKICKDYYHKKYIENDEESAKNILSSILKNYKPVKVICEVLWGVNNLTKQNIYRLLVINNFVSTKNISGFIMLLNSCGIITYSKKTNKITINFNPRSKITFKPTLREEYIISPNTPYSNIKSLREIIRNCKKYLWWLDKHFSSKGLEPLADEVDGNKIKEIRILLSRNSNIDFTKLRKDFIRFKQEMQNRGINALCRVIIDKNIIKQIHGRWILSENFCYKIPPINSIFMGQYDEITMTRNTPPFEMWWKEGKDILEDWDEISQLLQK